MPTVRELSDPYANFMLNPLGPSSQDVCEVCLTFTQGYETCFRCGHDEQHLDAVLPVSYSVHFGQLHTALAGYKRGAEPVARRFQMELAAVLWRFMNRHELCLAEQIDLDAFDVVTSVPSSSPRAGRPPIPCSGSSQKGFVHLQADIFLCSAAPTSRSRTGQSIPRSTQRIARSQVRPFCW